MKFSSVSPEILFKSYYNASREDPMMGVRRIMWMMIYDDFEAAWALKFLNTVGVLKKPVDEKEQEAQLQKIHRLRKKETVSCGLPSRGKRGGTDKYQDAVAQWRAINPRPSEQELLDGWIPRPLGVAALKEEADQTKEDVNTAELSPPPAGTDDPLTEIPSENLNEEDIEENDGSKPKKRASVEMPPAYTPEQYIPKPPPELKVVICGQPKDAD